MCPRALVVTYHARFVAWCSEKMYLCKLLGARSHPRWDIQNLKQQIKQSESEKVGRSMTNRTMRSCDCHKAASPGWRVVVDLKINVGVFAVSASTNHSCQWSGPEGQDTSLCCTAWKGPRTHAWIPRIQTTLLSIMGKVIVQVFLLSVLFSTQPCT